MSRPPGAIWNCRSGFGICFTQTTRFSGMASRRIRGRYLIVMWGQPVRPTRDRRGRADPAHEKVDPGGDRPPSRDRSAEARLEVLVEQGTHPEPDDPGEEEREGAP